MKFDIGLKTVLVGSCAALTAAAVLAAPIASAAWPERDVTLFVHSGAGSPTDEMVRAFAKGAEEVTGKNFVVIVKKKSALPALLKAKADGYTLSSQTRSFLGSIASKKTSLRMDQFQWVARLVGESPVFAVRSDSGIRSLDELFAKAKKRPGQLMLSTYKAGSTTQADALLVANLGQAKFNVIPYSSGGKLVVAMLGGNVDVSATFPSKMIQHVEKGTVRVLFVSSPQRHPKLPKVPTLKELGYNVTLSHWRGLITKAGVPERILKEIDVVAQKATRSKAFQSFIAKRGLDDFYLDHGSISKAVAVELKSITKFYKKMGIVRKKKK